MTLRALLGILSSHLKTGFMVCGWTVFSPPPITAEFFEPGICFESSKVFIRPKNPAEGNLIAWAILS